MAEIEKVLEWASSEGFQYDGFKLWRQKQYDLYESHYLFYTTSELIQLYNRNGRKRTDPKTS